MRRTVVVLLVILLASCARKNTLFFSHGLKLASFKELVNNQGEMKRLDDSIFMYYNKGIYLFKIPVGSYTFFNDSLLSNTAVYNYFIYRENAKEGFYRDFRDSGQKGFLKMSVDSFHKNYMYPDLGVWLPSNDSLISVRKIRDTDTTIITYYNPIKPDASYYDTSQLYFHPSLQFKKYFYKKSLEDSMGLSFVKFRFIYNSHFDEQYGMMLPRREWLFFMEAENKEALQKINEEYDKKLKQLLN